MNKRNVIQFPGRGPADKQGRRLIPAKLYEARIAERLNQTELAAIVDVSRQAVSAYEQGEKVPVPSTMQAIADALHQPLSYFTQEAGPTFGKGSANFYRKVGADTKRRNRACDVYSDWLSQTAFVFDAVANYPAVDIPRYEPESEVNLRYEVEEIEEIAESVRNHFGLGLGPISNVLRLLETKGVVICRVQVPNENIEAFSFWNGPRPFIFLASEKDSCARSRFDAAHELGHLALHGWVGEEEIEEKARLKEIESEADRFAGAFLLPRQSFPHEVYTPRAKAFIELKKRWKVSIQAMIYRCKHLGIFDEQQIVNLYKQISANRWRKKEPLDDPIEMPLEEPLLLRRIVELVVDNHKLHRDYIKNALAFSPSIIEQLAGLPKDYLSAVPLPDFTPTLK